MDRDRMIRLAQTVERSRSFDQSHWWIYPGHRIEGEDPHLLAQRMYEGQIECGTPACLAGHALALFYDDLAHYDEVKWSEVLGLALDVPWDASFALSNGEWDCDEIAAAFDIHPDLLWDLFKHEDIEDPDTGGLGYPIPDNRTAAKALRLIAQHVRDD